MIPKNSFAGITLLAHAALFLLLPAAVRNAYCGQNPVKVYSWAYPYPFEPYEYKVGVPVRLPSSVSPMHHGRLAVAVHVKKTELVNGVAKRALLLGPGNALRWYPCEPPESCVYVTPDSNPCDLPPECQLLVAGTSVRMEPETWHDKNAVFLRFFGDMIFAGNAYNNYSGHVQTLFPGDYCGGKHYIPIKKLPTGQLSWGAYGFPMHDEAQTFYVYGHPFDYDDANKDGDYEYGLASITVGLDPVKYEELNGHTLKQVIDGVMMWANGENDIVTFTNTAKSTICKVDLSEEEILGYGHGTVVTVTKGPANYLPEGWDVKIYPNADPVVKRPIATEFEESQASSACLINRNGYVVLLLDKAKYPLCYVRAGDMQSHALKFDPWWRQNVSDPHKVYLLDDNTLLWTRKTWTAEDGNEFLIQEADLNRSLPAPEIVFRGSLLTPDPQDTAAKEFRYDLLGADQQGMFIFGDWIDGQKAGGTIFWHGLHRYEMLSIKGKVIDEQTKYELSGVTVSLYRVGEEDPIQSTVSNPNGTFLFYDVEPITDMGDKPYLLKTDAGPAQIRSIRLNEEELVLSDFYLPAEMRTEAGDQEVLIELVATPTLSAKRIIAERLMDLSKNNYKPTEQEVISHLTTLQDKFDNIQPNEVESVKRAIIAERIARLAGFESQDLLRELIKGMAAMLVDITSDVVKFKLKDLNLLESVGGKVAPNKEALLRNVLLNKNAQKFLNSSISFMLELTDYLAKIVVDEVVKEESTKKSIKNALTFFKRGLKTLNNIVAGKSFNAGGFLSVEEWALKTFLPDLFDSGTWFSYCSLTKPNLDYSLSKFKSWPTDDEAALKSDIGLGMIKMQTIQTITGEAMLQLGYGQDAAGILNKYDKLASPIGDALKATVVLAPIGGAIKATGKAAKYGKYLGHFKALLEPIYAVFIMVPQLLEEGVHQAWHDPVAKQNEVPVTKMHASLLEGSSCAPLATDFLVRLRDALTQAKTLLASNDLDALSDHLLAVGSGVIELIQEANEELEEQSGKVFSILGQDPFGPGQDNPYNPSRMLSVWNALVESHGLAYDILMLYLQSVDDAFNGVTDFRYLAARNGFMQVIDQLTVELNSGVAFFELVNADIAQLTCRPLVAITEPSILSTATGLAFASQTPEPFTLAARIRNFSSEAIADLSVKLTIINRAEAVRITGADTQPIALLAADDGAEGSGADEAAVSFPVTYQGDLSEDSILFEITLLENGDLPESFDTYERWIDLSVDPRLLDNDLDGMPDKFETDHSLNLAMDDSLTDDDGDGLANIDEFRYGTDPKAPDTDSDGIKDREEIEGGKDGFVTEPLNADSDGDGTEDGADDSPLDPESTDEPQMVQKEPQVGLDKKVVFLRPNSLAADVDIQNIGDGTLTWMAFNSEPTILELYPESGDEEDSLNIKIKDTVNLDEVSSYLIEIPLGIMDLKGATKDVAGLTVVITDQAYSSVVHVSPDGFCAGLIPCFSSIQSGVDYAGSGALIKISAGTYEEEVSISGEKELTGQAGWDSQFSTNASNSIIDGSLTIQSAAVTVERIVIR